jgi:hypothetical protein
MAALLREKFSFATMPSSNQQFFREKAPAATVTRSDRHARKPPGTITRETYVCNYAVKHRYIYARNFGLQLLREATTACRGVEDVYARKLNPQLCRENKDNYEKNLSLQFLRGDRRIRGAPRTFTRESYLCNHAAQRRPRQRRLRAQNSICDYCAKAASAGDERRICRHRIAVAGGAPMVLTRSAAVLITTRRPGRASPPRRRTAPPARRCA